MQKNFSTDFAKIRRIRATCMGRRGRKG